MSEAVIIGVDLGGTRIRAAQCDRQLKILNRTETLTQADQGLEATLERIKNLIRAVIPTDGTQVIGIGVSAPGPLNPETGVIVAPPNLPGWHNVPLGPILEAEFGVPVFTGNDANVAALAETMRGAAVGHKNVIYITVSTGIGGGVITDSHLLLGQSGLGAEVGHIVMVVDGKVSSLEKESAGPSLARKLRGRIAAGESSQIVTDMVGSNLDQIDGKIVGAAALKGDPIALEVVKQGAHILGLGVVSLLHIFNPEIVVLGGGVTFGLGDTILSPMKDTIEKHSLDSAYWENLKIEVAKLSEDVSIIGSAALVITQGGVRRVDDVLSQIQPS
jgi:glucokinase